MCILAILGPSRFAGEFDLNRQSHSLRAISSLLAGTLLLVACTGYGHPDAPGTDLAFGVDMAKRGLWSEAMFRFQAAAKGDPDNPRVQSNLGVAYEAQGDFDKALEHYKKALQLAPDNKDIRANYARFVEYYQAYKSPDRAKQAKGFGKGILGSPSAPSGGTAVTGAGSNAGGSPTGPPQPPPPPSTPPAGAGEAPQTAPNPASPPPPQTLPAPASPPPPQSSARADLRPGVFAAAAFDQEACS
jgi:hypothetical protein